jgi:predicted Zn-dependent protease
MYFRAINSQPGGKISADLETSFHEAVYKASASADLETYLPFDKIASVDQPIALLAESRFSLYRGEYAQARQLLERARRLKPNMPEVTLLEAEIFIKEGKKPEARQLLNGLIASLDTPEWILALADTTLIQNP